MILLPILAPAVLTVSSPVFTDRASIPEQFTCEGKNVSPPLAWTGVPANARSLAIVVDDPDSAKGRVTHWIVTNIAPTVRSVDLGDTPVGSTTGVNTHGQATYAGPCPPSGRHHYNFTVYALDIVNPKAGNRAELMKSMTGHVVASGVLVGLYQKRH